jgi:catecholate siderophore receptor
MPVAAKDVPQSLTVINDKLIHDQGKDSQERARKRHRHHL